MTPKDRDDVVWTSEQGTDGAREGGLDERSSQVDVDIPTDVETQVHGDRWNDVALHLRVVGLLIAPRVPGGLSEVPIFLDQTMLPFS